MPRQGITAYDLLISCPGDVNKYAEVIKECLEGFNTVIGRINNVEIVGRHWSTDGYAQSGDKPQELLNKQFVRDCDAAVAVFWTRFGTPTDKYGSGTEEEIEEMISAQKQVFVYFVEEDVNLNSVDIEQYKKVQEFKEKYKSRGIFFSAKNTDDFRRLFTNHLSMHFLPIIVGEKQSAFSEPAPQLCIKDYSYGENFKSIQSPFSNSRFIEEKENFIIREIESLKESYLESRSSSENEDDSLESDSSLAEGKQAIQNIQLLINTTSEADIPDEWKMTINRFADELKIDIPDDFWNVGNLKKSVLNLSPMLGGGISYSGSDEEKSRFNSLQDLYWNVREFNEYQNYFRILDSFHLLRLVVANTGTSFDEDIDVKLILEKGLYVKGNSLPIPGRNIIEELLEIKFIENSYKIKATDKVDAFSGYPVHMPRVNFKINDPFHQKSDKEEYDDNVEQYSDTIKEVFCYDFYEKSDEDVLVFHINYLKHNTMMAFPAYLVFRRAPVKISYEISSKHIPNVIRGELKVEE